MQLTSTRKSAIRRPRRRKVAAAEVSYDTVTLSKTYGVVEYDAGNLLHGEYSENLTNFPTVPKAGKRVIYIHFTYRLTNYGYDNYDDWFKISGAGGSATFTIGGQTPTLLEVGRSKFNATASYVLEADLNTSGSNSTVTFDWDNTSYISDPAVSDPGGAAIALYVFDYVESYAANHESEDDDTNGTTTTSYLNLAPGGTGDGWTATAKLVTGVASNPDEGVNPHWTKGSGETDSTYTVLNEGDNGTKEVTESSYAFFQSGTPTNMTGRIGLDSGSASAGVGIIATHIRFKPSTS